MNVSRSGYYKWLSRKGNQNRWKKNRESLAIEIKKVHSHHSTYGYRHIAQTIRNATGEVFQTFYVIKSVKNLELDLKLEKHG